MSQELGFVTALTFIKPPFKWRLTSALSNTANKFYSCDVTQKQSARLETLSVLETYIGCRFEPSNTRGPASWAAFAATLCAKSSTSSSEAKIRGSVTANPGLVNFISETDRVIAYAGNGILPCWASYQRPA